MTQQYDFEMFTGFRTDIEFAFYIQVLIFVVIELAKKGKFSTNYRKLCVDYARKILELNKSLKDQANDEKNTDLEESQEPESLASQGEFIVEYVFFHQYQLLALFGLKQHELSMFVADLSNAFASFFYNSDKYIGFYRNKLVGELHASIEAENLENCETVISIAESFNFGHEESIELMHKIVQVKLKDSKNHEFLIKLFIFCLQSLTKLKKTWIPKEDFVKCASITLELDALQQIEEPLIEYLMEFPQNIPHLPIETLNALICGQITKNTVRLVCLIFERGENQQPRFESLILENLEKKELVYPLLNVGTQKRWISSLSKETLAKVFAEFKTGILKTVEKPQKVGVIYKENVLSSISLIVHCMPINECIDFCGKLFKFNGCELYQFQILATVYFKAVQNVKGKLNQFFID